MLPKTIDEVIQTLEEIIEDAIQNNSALGLFPALYKQVTVKVKEGIEKGEFENGERMERLDVTFANRYIDAYQNFQAGKPTTKSWAVAFQAAKDNHLILLQHLLIGMNAHINLDLGIAAAEIAYGDEIESLHHDFNQINVILNSLVEKVQKEIGAVSPMMYVVEWLMKGKDEVFAEFSMGAARDFAWLNANNFASLPKEDWPETIKDLDDKVCLFGKFITHPGFLLGLAVKATKWLENKNIRLQIEAMNPSN
jgi:hypothetical protein